MTSKSLNRLHLLISAHRNAVPGYVDDLAVTREAIVEWVAKYGNQQRRLGRREALQSLRKEEKK